MPTIVSSVSDRVKLSLVTFLVPRFVWFPSRQHEPDDLEHLVGYGRDRFRLRADTGAGISLGHGRLIRYTLRPSSLGRVYNTSTHSCERPVRSTCILCGRSGVLVSHP